MKCQVPGCESTDLVYSGVDAAMLYETHITERFCHNCSKAYVIIKRAFEALVGATKNELHSMQ